MGGPRPLSFRERERGGPFCGVDALSPSPLPMGEGTSVPLPRREETGLPDEFHQLPMNVEPFPHSIERQEVLPAGLAELTSRKLRFQLVVEVPELQIGDEIGLFVGRKGVRGIGGLLLVQRPLARILHRQRRGDDENLVQAALVGGGQNHPPKTRVDRQAAQLAADFGQLPLGVDRAEFDQRAVSVVDRLRLRGIEEREAFDRAKPQGLRLQNDGRQVAPLDLGRGVGVAGGVILFAEQPHANARPNPPAAAFALIGQRAGNRLDRQALRLAPRRVAADPCRARIDHVANPRHRQRRLGHIGGDHYAAFPARLEHPLLLAPSTAARTAAESRAAAHSDRPAAAGHGAI